MGAGYEVKVTPEVNVEDIVERMKSLLVDQGVKFEGKDGEEWVLIAALEILSGTRPKDVWDSAMGAKKTMGTNTAAAPSGGSTDALTPTLNAKEREVWANAKKRWPGDTAHTMLALHRDAIAEYDRKGFNKRHALRELNKEMPHLFTTVPRS